MKKKILSSLISGKLLAVFCLLSCSDNNDPITEEPDPEEPGIEVVEPELFRANRIFIRHGLQLQCWVATDNYELGGKAGQPAYNLSIPDWKLTGFTGPTFYGPPLINTSYFKEFPDSQWAIAKAPHADQLKKGPTDYEKKNGFLSEDQLKYLNNLTTICFGDEEHYSFEVAKFLKEWYDVARRLYPDVLVHNNQYPNQWTRENLLTYIKLAKPDLLTYDWYYFHTWDKDNYIGAKDMAGHLAEYRDLALGGWEGNKKDYMAFGQYSQGYVNEGTYKLTGVAIAPVLLYDLDVRREVAELVPLFARGWLWRTNGTDRLVTVAGTGNAQASDQTHGLGEPLQPREPAYWRLFGAFENNRCPLCAGYHQIYGRQTGDDFRS